MTAAGLVATLEARGVALAVEGEELVIRPAERVRPEEMAHLRTTKPDVVALLKGRAIGTDWQRVGLWQLDRILEVAVPWSDVRLLIAPGCRVARELRRSDLRPGRVWCVCEISDLLLSGVTAEDVRAIAEARVAFDADWLGVAAEPSPIASRRTDANGGR